MTSDRIQRNIDRLLDEADTAFGERDWSRLRDCAQDVLSLDPDNTEARSFLAAAERNLTRSPAVPSLHSGVSGAAPPSGGHTVAEVDDIQAVAAPVTNEEESSTTHEQEGRGEGQPEGQYPPKRPLAGAGGSAALPGASTPSSVGAPESVPAAFVNGHYVVKRFLGEGGKKRVYLTHDTLLDRDVAFALIKTDGLDGTGRDRIKREAQAMGRMGAHPHIVSVFDLGENRPLSQDWERAGVRASPRCSAVAEPRPPGAGGLSAHPDIRAGAGETPGLPRDRAEAMRHLDIAIAELRDTKMQPALERALRHKEVLKA